MGRIQIVEAGMIKTFCSGDSLYYIRDDFDTAVSQFLQEHPDSHLQFIPGQLENSWGESKFGKPVLWAIFHYEEE